MPTAIDICLVHAEVLLSILPVLSKSTALAIVLACSCRRLVTLILNILSLRLLNIPLQFLNVSSRRDFIELGLGVNNWRILHVIYLVVIPLGIELVYYLGLDLLYCLAGLGLVL